MRVQVFEQKVGIVTMLRLTDEEVGKLVAMRGELHAPWPVERARGWFANAKDLTAWRTARFVSVGYAPTSNGEQHGCKS